MSAQNSNSQRRTFLVEDLVSQCQHYIAMHLEVFPVSHLSLLPLSTRRDILWRLPLADVCQLEDTNFTQGLDMTAYWKSPWECVYLGVAAWCQWPDYDIQNYVQTEWESLEHARATLYGLLTTCAIGNLNDEEFEFVLPYQCGDDEYMSEQYISAISLLYAVRKPDHDLHAAGSKYRLIFPPRYSHKSSKVEEDLTVPEVMKCFSRELSELPRVFPQIEVYNDVEHDYAAIVPCYLRSAVYIGATGHLFTQQGLDFLKAIIKEATQLEVLILDNWGREGTWETEFFDEFIAYLCSYPKFFSNLRLFKILSSMSGLGFTVSRENFNNLMTTFFTAPTDHMQKLQITQAKIKCSDIAFECSPAIDQQYLAFKTVELDNCEFISKYKATPQAISHWLGQGISELPRLDPRPVEAGVYYFKVGSDENGDLSRKRKFSELDQEFEELEK